MKWWLLQGQTSIGSWERLGLPNLMPIAGRLGLPNLMRLGAPLQGTPSSGIRQPFNEKRLSPQNKKTVDTKPKVVSAKYWKMICGAHKQLPVVQLPLVELVCYHHRENCILMFLLAHLLHDDLPLAAF